MNESPLYANLSKLISTLEKELKEANQRIAELEVIASSVVRLNSNDVCELAMEWLDMNNPDPDKVSDIAERMGMGWDESKEEFLDLDNIELKVTHRRKIYGLTSTIFQLEEALKPFTLLDPKHPNHLHFSGLIEKAKSLLTQQ